jgi:hypothetical protein
MQVTTKIENLSAEGMALGILASLRAAARAQYTAANVGYSVAQAAIGATKGNELPPAKVRRGFMQMAYDEVIDLLPADSPFRESLQAFRDAEIANVAE